MSQPSPRLLHVEWVMDDGSLDSSDVHTPTAAFMLANDLLFVEESTKAVKVWFAGDRNVPTELTKANIHAVARTWTDR